MDKDRSIIERLESLAHDFAFTTLGLFYWENFLIGEYHYNGKYPTYKRKW